MTQAGFLKCPNCGKEWPDDYDGSHCDCGYEIDSMAFEPRRCQKCKKCISLDDGCDPSPFCHYCCQGMVAKWMDPTPIDEDFAAKVRSERVILQWSKSVIDRETWYLVIDTSIYSDWSGQNTIVSSICGHVATRGQVYSLCHAAGVECDAVP